MYKALEWIKQNKILTLFAIIIIWLLWPQVEDNFPYNSSYYDRSLDYTGSAAVSSPSESKTSGIIPPVDNYPPQNNDGERLVTRNASLSMVVNSVKDTIDKIILHVETAGGYIVNSSLTYPEEVPYATVAMRIPSEKLNAASEYIKSLGMKITSENITGQDVTDEYVDLNSHIASLAETKTRYEEIRAKADKVEDLVRVQQELTNIQTQIDTYKGRQMYLEQIAHLSYISVTLSTDELALPYTPTETFRPAVIFKEAVRGLYTTLRSWAETGIWLGVYSVIWIPLLIIGIILWKKYSRKPQI